MKTTISENQVPPTPPQVEGETIHKVPSESIKLSSEAITFQDQKVRDLASMPELSTMEGGMCGCQNPLKAPFQETSLDRVRASTRRFRESLMYSVPGAIREQAVDTLNLLIRFDMTVTKDESRILMDAVKIIQSKGTTA